MSQVFTLLVDDQDSQVNYLCSTLKQQDLGSYSNNTWSTISSQSCQDGWFEYAFYGTGIRVEIPTTHPSQDVSVTLDSTPITPQQDGSFQSPVLPDGPHTLKYAIGNVSLTPVFDYLTVTAGPSTPLDGRTLIVDDTDGAISFQGNWSSNPPKPSHHDYSTSLYRDTAHWSTTVGDTLQFEFTGTSVSVFGLAANISGPNNLTASYSIDGVTKTQRIPKGTFDSVPMTQFFHAGDLAAGRHTLVINLTDLTYPQAFGVDFIAYNSSANSITELPGYQPSANAAPIISGAVSRSNKAAIAGGVLGAVGFFGLLVAGYCAWRRSRRAKKPAAVQSSSNSSYDDIEASKYAA